jgi:hypothetical protein
MNKPEIIQARAALSASALVLLLTGAGCDPEVPDEPTWAEDVRPILMANCASCHSFPPIRSAPGPTSIGDGLRLDVYEDTILDEGTQFRGTDVSGRAVPGAASVADRIVARAVELETMPPPLTGGKKRPLSSRQQEILLRWYEQGAQRGPPAPGNRPPQMQLRSPPQQSGDGDVLIIEYEISDADFDYVTGELRAHYPRTGYFPPQPPILITRQLHSGRGQVYWGVGDLRGERFELIATLDDGSVIRDVSLGLVDID